MLVDYLKPIEVPTLAVDLSEYMTAQELIKLADRVNEVREASFSAQCIDWTHMAKVMMGQRPENEFCSEICLPVDIDAAALDKLLAGGAA